MSTIEDQIRTNLAGPRQRLNIFGDRMGVRAQADLLKRMEYSARDEAEWLATTDEIRNRLVSYHQILTDELRQAVDDLEAHPGDEWYQRQFIDAMSNSYSSANVEDLTYYYD